MSQAMQQIKTVPGQSAAITAQTSHVPPAVHGWLLYRVLMERSRNKA